MGRSCANGHGVRDDARFCEECGVALSSADDDSRRGSRRRRNRILLVAGGVVAVAAVTVGALVLIGDDDDRGPDTRRNGEETASDTSVRTSERPPEESTTTSPPTTTSPMTAECPLGSADFPPDEPGFVLWEAAARCVLAAWRSDDLRLLAELVEPEVMAMLDALDSPAPSLRLGECSGNTGIGCDVSGGANDGRFDIGYSASGRTTSDGLPIATRMAVLDLPSDEPILYGNGLGDAHLGDDFDAAVDALIEQLGPSDAELFVGCVGVRQIAWSRKGVFLQSEDGQQVTHIRLFEASDGDPPFPTTLAGTRVGEPFGDLQAAYDGRVVDHGPDLYGNWFEFETGANVGVSGIYDPYEADGLITELAIGQDVCGD